MQPRNPTIMSNYGAIGPQGHKAYMYHTYMKSFVLGAVNTFLHKLHF